MAARTLFSDVQTTRRPNIISVLFHACYASLTYTLEWMFTCVR